MSNFHIVSSALLGAAIVEAWGLSSVASPSARTNRRPRGLDCYAILVKRKVNSYCCLKKPFMVNFWGTAAFPISLIPGREWDRLFLHEGGRCVLSAVTRSRGIRPTQKSRFGRPRLRFTIVMARWLSTLKRANCPPHGAMSRPTSLRKNTSERRASRRVCSALKRTACHRGCGAALPTRGA